METSLTVNAAARSDKKFMYVCRRAPFGTIYGLEMVEAILASSAFDQEICTAFIDDGVYQLKDGQKPSLLGMKNYAKTFKAFPDFGVGRIYVEMESLQIRGLGTADLISIPRDDGSDSVLIISSCELSEMMDAQDVILEL